LFFCKSIMRKDRADGSPGLLARGESKGQIHGHTAYAAYFMHISHLKTAFLFLISHLQSGIGVGPGLMPEPYVQHICMGI
jgi:hypothetical protein